LIATTPRKILGVVPAYQTLEGEGFLVHRAFPTPWLADVDPFLLLDHMGPADLAPGEAKGAPDHPHRGFETVTYMLEGAMVHKDSQGHQGRLGPGDVQWMTAGAGVIHSEMPSAEFLDRGGRMNGFQLWVNLPRADKLMRPRYQELPADRIPAAKSPDGRVEVRVIAGEAYGARAVIETRTPIVYLHFAVRPGGRVAQPLAPEFDGFAFVIAGEGRFGPESQAATPEQVVVFEHKGDLVVAESAGTATLEFLLIAGVPLGEPIARYGPFVMNTTEEIHQAFEDFRSGRFGVIDF